MKNSLEKKTVHKSTKIVGCILATIGLAYAVKHIMHHKEGCCSCGWHKIKVEDEKPTGATASNNTNGEDEKLRGSRYGSNPIRY
jgi:hypothetical protein